MFDSEAVESFITLKMAKTQAILAIDQCEDIGKAIKNVLGDVVVPHRAFMIYPGNERRMLIDCLIKPISKWALGNIFRMLNSRGVEATYMDIKRYPRAASFRGQLWENIVIGKGYKNPWGTGQGYAWVRVGVSFFNPWQTLTLGAGPWVGRGFG